MLLLFSVLGLLSSVFAAAPEPVDLGHNLFYLRLPSLVDSAPALHSALSANRALVLDLRFTTADEESLTVLRAALALPPRKAPLFILISPATPAGVVEAINQTPDAFISLGATSSRSARITVKTDAETDRRAYDALDAGTPLAALISGKIEKERFDEASLVLEFKNGNHGAEPPAPPDPTAPKASNSPKLAPTPVLIQVAGPAPVVSTLEPGPVERPAVPPGPGPGGDRSPVERPVVSQLTDRVLQRAVHLHRALLALKSSG